MNQETVMPYRFLVSFGLSSTQHNIYLFAFGSGIGWGVIIDLNFNFKF